MAPKTASTRTRNGTAWIDSDSEDDDIENAGPASNNLTPQRDSHSLPARNKSKRKRNGVGRVDPDSDNEVDIDVSATASNGQTEFSYTQHSTKRAKGSHVQQTGTLHPDPELDGKNQPEDPETEKKRKQGASVMMKLFSGQFETLQDVILSHEHHRDLGKPCMCGKQEAIYRCSGNEKCFDSHIRCKECILKDHVSNPYHRIDKWCGTHFVPSSLDSLGFKLYLGHHGDRCPNLSATSRPRPVTVVHTNGYHIFSVHFCHCHKSESEYVQLMAAALFPATIAQPETAFTFGLLSDFHIHTLTSKKSAYDYHDALVKLSNAAFPQDVPKRYAEFNRINRVWQHLADVRRSGQAHDIDMVITQRKCGSLGVRCPACPEIGINIDKETIELASEDEAHKYTLFISADGNFRLQRQHKRDDPDDVALKGGNSYFVDVAPYRVYLLHVGPCTDDCVCAHLRATRLQNIIKFKNAVVSGVIAIQCARHGFFLPQGMADLKKGEAFANTDYVLAHSLGNAHLQRWIMFSYDVFCSYRVNLKKRFDKYFPATSHLIDRMRGAIPKMHIKNHIEKCQWLWSFNYLKYSGSTYGEKIEQSWGEGNQAGGSTKEMNDGHRHDSLDDYHNFYNWTKLHKLPNALYSSYTKCLDSLKTRVKKFKEFNACMKPELVEKWESVDETPRIEKGKVISVHAPNIKNGPPTQAKTYENLIKKEMTAELSGKGKTGDALFIQNGLKLEEEQSKLRKLALLKTPSGKESDALLSGRVKLRRELLDFRQMQFNLYPTLRDHINDGMDLTKPEIEKLYFPSSFNQALRSSLKLDKLATVEYSLREGQAYDALEKVRLSIKIFNFNVGFKKAYVHGQGPNTRAQDYLRTLTNDKKNAADTYRRTRSALISLGLSDKDPCLQELLDTQLWSKDTSRPARLGDTRKEDPWFWTVGTPAGLSDKEKTDWSTEMDRVKWYRECSRRDRAQEEKEILEEEMKRTIRYFEFMRNTWTTLATRSPDISPGRAAYAHKQASMYSRFADDTKKLERKAQEKCRIYEEWYNSKGR